MAALSAGSGGFINPEAVISQLQIKEGMKVADFGCGHGYFSLPLAKMVGKTGRVYAIDVLQDSLDNVKSKAEIEGLNNIETIKGNLEMEGGSKLPNIECDFVILANVLYQSQKKEKIIKEALRVLKVQGRMVIIDWRADDLTIGPQEGWRVSEDEIKEMARNQGALFLQNFQTGNFHYGLVFVR